MGVLACCCGGYGRGGGVVSLELGGLGECMDFFDVTILMIDVGVGVGLLAFLYLCLYCLVSLMHGCGSHSRRTCSLATTKAKSPGDRRKGIPS